MGELSQWSEYQRGSFEDFEVKWKQPDSVAERIHLARIWLRGYIKVTNGIHQHKRIEEPSLEDKLCRHSLAQLLVDGDAPREILDLLARLIAPDSDVSPKVKLKQVGIHLFRSGKTGTDLALTGNDDVLRFCKRDGLRFSDPNLIGRIITLVRERTEAHVGLEQAFHEVSGIATDAGIRGMSERNVKKIWYDNKELRKVLWGPNR